MEQFDTKELIFRLKELEGKQAALAHAGGILYYDAVTTAPKNTAQGRGVTMGVLSGMEHELLADPKNGVLLDRLEARLNELDEQTRREIELVRKSYEQLSRIPAAEYREYSILINDAQCVWERAKLENDFAAFAPYLEKILDYNRRFAGYYNPDMPVYDALLNEYEEGMTTGILDRFFADLRKQIVPLLKKVQTAPQIDDSFLHKNYPIEKQRAFSEYLMSVLQIDRGHCGIGETEHPFTTNFNNRDVRITTHYHANDLASSMYSVIHESGHAIYELGCDDCYNYTAVSGGVSMGIHESQSRFFENLVGRSREFINLVFPKLAQLFPEQLVGVDSEMFYRAVNRVDPSLIRTEADELTYSLHIMVRYELEKQLIGGSLSVYDLPKAWNTLYLEYLGIEVPSDREGCLQDSHWSGGAIGYFPSYALGSAYAVQMFEQMQKALGDVCSKVAAGDISAIKDWLKTNIHRYAAFYKPGELFERACGRFDAHYYTEYLKDKFTALYGLLYE